MAKGTILRRHRCCCYGIGHDEVLLPVSSARRQRHHRKKRSIRRPLTTTAFDFVSSFLLSLVYTTSVVAAFASPKPGYLWEHSRFQSSVGGSDKWREGEYRHCVRQVACFVKSIRDSATTSLSIDNVVSDSSLLDDSKVQCGAREVSATAPFVTSTASNNTDDDSNSCNNNCSLSEDTLGLIILATVPMVWGSYVPVVRGLYEIDPPIPGFVFSAAYFSVASISTSCLLMLRKQGQKQPNKQHELQQWNQPNDLKAMSLTEESSQVNQRATFGINKTPSWKIPVLAGVELGSYLFVGNSLQVLGLKTVPSDRAGFLVQLTTVLVPLVQATVSGSLFTSVSLQTWVACIVALAGIAIIGYDGTDLNLSIASLCSPSSSMPSLTTGDCLILGAAFVYSLHVVRLGRWANETEPLQLVACKATTELILSLILIAYLVRSATDASSTLGVDEGVAAVTTSGLLSDFSRQSGQEIATFFKTLGERIQSQSLSAGAIQKAIGATLWTGLVSTAYTTYAQSYGQRRVKPADANLIYSLQPIFTALFAYVLLGETMGPFGFCGGALIGGAVYLAASQSFSSVSSEKKTSKILDTEN